MASRMSLITRLLRTQFSEPTGTTQKDNTTQSRMVSTAGRRLTKQPPRKHTVLITRTRRLALPLEPRRWRLLRLGRRLWLSLLREQDLLLLRLAGRRL